MKRLLKKTCKIVSHANAKHLSKKDYARLVKCYRSILVNAEKQLPPITAKPSGKRGKLTKSDAHNLHERLKNNESAILLFANNPDVPFTNNRAERDLRMSKVKQKVSRCFHTPLYAGAFCRISSYTSPCSNSNF